MLQGNPYLFERAKVLNILISTVTCRKVYGLKTNKKLRKEGEPKVYLNNLYMTCFIIVAHKYNRRLA